MFRGEPEGHDWCRGLIRNTKFMLNMPRERAMGGSVAMRFVFRNTRPYSCCKDVWREGTSIEAGKPEGKKS